MWIKVETLHPFVALSHVLIDQESCELESALWKGPTLKSIYNILKQLTSELVDEESEFLNTTVNLVCGTNINIEDAIDTSGRLGYSSSVYLPIVIKAHFQQKRLSMDGLNS